MSDGRPAPREAAPAGRDDAGLLVLDLARIDAGMLAIAGGKAANLGVMLQAGLPVPPGICVTTEAYRQVAASASIDFDALEAAQGDALRRAAAGAREALLAAAVPEAIARAVAAGYAGLGPAVPVAVRSSATAEDLPFASFAGQQDTYLHVIGSEAVLEAVRRCWSSLWTDRAVVYRATNAIDHRTVRLAVVVQRMVESEVAGVLFTAHPVSGNRRQAVIDASPGLGEAVVSGAVNPDHFVVDCRNGGIVERRLGDKRVEVRPVAGGGVRHVERLEEAERACVTDEQVRALVSLGSRVETLYGAPQDIEWAIDGGGALWLTQARPITTLFPLPVGPRTPDKGPPDRRDDDFRVYFCFSVAQGLYRPITPMGRAAFRILSTAPERLFGFPVTDPMGGAHVYAEAGQRVFIDLTGVLRGSVGRALMPRLLDLMEARSAAILRSLFTDPRLSVTRRSPLSFLRRALRLAVRYLIPVRIVQALARPDAALTRADRIGRELAARLQPPSDADPGARLDFAERVLREEIVFVAPRLLPLAAAGLGMLAFAGKLLGEDARAGDLPTVLRGLPNNITTQMDLALWEVARGIRDDAASMKVFQEETTETLARRFHDGSLPGPARRALAEFLARFGHRAVAEIDIGMPRWRDDPSYVLGVIANYLRLDDPEMAPDAVFRRGAVEAQAMIGTLVSRARVRSRLRARLVRFALDRARRLSGLREVPKYQIVVALAAVRGELAGVGKELARLKRIECPDDIFWLDFEQARAALQGGKDCRGLVEERRQAYEAELHRRHVPSVLLSDGTEPEAAAAAGAGSKDGLTGTAASAGSVTGTARVIFDPVGAHLEPGEILVTPSTDPGWTPLFLTAGGLVMEMGGANSHGAVVAREYGIPAVVGVLAATRRIRTGQRIRVDGTAGVVALDPAGEGPGEGDRERGHAGPPKSDAARRGRRG